MAAVDQKREERKEKEKRRGLGLFALSDVFRVYVMRKKREGEKGGDRFDESWGSLLQGIPEMEGQREGGGGTKRRVACHDEKKTARREKKKGKKKKKGLFRILLCTPAS